MARTDLIPTGRTSLVKLGATELQIQTEYAYRPVPRITTTVLRTGQVIQKIEMNLDQPITSLAEKDRIEVAMRKQHAEVIDIIQRGSQRIPIPVELQEKPIRPSYKPSLVASEPKPYPEPEPVATMLERLERLPGIHRVYRLDNGGNFENAAVSKEFQKAFKDVFKNLHDVLTVFAEVPGIGLTRESGVIEIEHDALYLVSTGLEIYIFCLTRPDYSIDYEKQLRAMLR
ncbi:MAG: hypothetical protein AB1772_07270 [Candidatus Zixiibacteriota bacterium]